ncbi:helix-turn-helix domain-containing protein [Faecalispora anaeroviscerum]|uniref:helix-turn-helix domain-containing protein n=1 Tax=Faecalispora anaeroviscerum TaxID=2991836 RepID=UPI0024BA1D2E|nr:helix-turn-helix transcriptional regulator [Faecalispora anaeroviscerum]
MSILSENIKRYRNQKGLTQAELGKLIEKAPSVIANWEAETNRPDVDSIAKMLEIFEIDANTFLGWNAKNSPAPAEAETGELNKQEQTLIHNYRALNDEGQEKLLDYSDDLVSSSKYTKNNQPEISQEA